jgi:HPt (histidine-containing phosphotransfer) domain-containing protein
MNEHSYKYINLEYLYEIADNETDFVKEMINDYIAKLPVQFHELETAFAEKDFPQTGFIAHKLKSSFQFMGASQLIILSQEIEQLSKESKEEDIRTRFSEMVPIIDLVLNELNNKLTALS